MFLLDLKGKRKRKNKILFSMLALHHQREGNTKNKMLLELFLLDLKGKRKRKNKMLFRIMVRLHHQREVKTKNKKLFRRFPLDLKGKKKRENKNKQVLTGEPWRNTERWSKEVREEFKNDIARRFPETYGQLDVPYYNIALTGEIGAGKSSYFNSLNNIFREEVTGARADVGKMATSLTTEYRVYKIKPKGTFEHLPWRICDTMGLQSNKPNDSSNILKAVNGHVPDRFKFTDEEINQDTPGYIADPELKDKAHCVAIVVNATKLELMNEEVKQKLKTLRKELGAPRTYILLTHIDEVCTEVEKNVTKVYHSIAIRDVVRKVGSMLDGLPENQIFPIRNYSEQVKMNDDMDILLLYPLRQMLSNAQNYLNDELDQQPRQSSHAPLTQRGQLVMQPAD